MVRLGDPDLRIRTAGLLAAVHEGDHPRQIRLIGENLKVVEQLHVGLESVWHTRRLYQLRPLPRTLLLGLLDPTLRISQRLEIVTQLGVVRCAQLVLKLLHASGYRVEDAAILAQARRAHARISAVGRSEQPLEDNARVVLSHERQRRRPPRERAAVRTAVADIARSHEAVVVSSELQRREL